MLDIPACATFADEPERLPAPDGLEALTRGLSVPFSAATFTALTKDRDSRTTLEKQFFDRDIRDFQQSVNNICRRQLGPDEPTDSIPYLNCAYAIEMAAANPQIKDPQRKRTGVFVPAAVKWTYLGDAQPQYSYVALKEGVNASDGAERVESTLRFVTEVKSVDGNCASAAVKNHGAWPVNIDQFQRALSMSGIMDKSDAPSRLLVVDTGFDFADGALIGDRVAKLAFGQRYFHRFELGADSDPSKDRNDDGVNGNGGWAGVNLSGNGSTSAETSVQYDRRSHGLSVTTLALGGRDLEVLRRISFLPIRIGEASIVELNLRNPYFHSGHIMNSMKYANASGNKFNVINLSLASSVNVSGLEELVKSKSQAIVVAAGNDGIELKSGVRVWPAVLGGKAERSSNGEGVFITVGAHDGAGARAKFSNWGSRVDILAPGCMVPSYELKIGDRKKAIGFSPADVSGTSFAAPIVSFAVALLMSTQDFADQPGLAKSRIQIASDYNYDLKDDTYSSGTLNIAKIIGFRHDVVALGDRKNPKIWFGKLSVRQRDWQLQCGAESLPFNAIRKIARTKKPVSREEDWVLVFSSKDDARPSDLTRHFCSVDSLNGVEYDFVDAETESTLPLKATEVWDYIAGL